MNLRVVARKKYALRFSMGSLHFSLETREDSINLPQFFEKNVEVLWKNEWHTSSAQLPQDSFSKAYILKVILLIKISKTSKMNIFWRHHQNVMREIFFKVFEDVILVERLLKPIRVINHQLPIDLDTYKRKYWSLFKTAGTPSNKNSWMKNIIIKLQF